MLYRVLADVVLALHAAFVAFVVVGLLLVLVGWALGWRWVRNFWFRMAHLVAILVVVVQTWADVICPLTTWENALRRRAGEEGYSGTFMTHWLRRIIFFEAESWVFTVSYTVFAALVVATWLFARPRRPGRATGTRGKPGTVTNS